MFCPNCGNKISDNAKFCENCGAQIVSADLQEQYKQTLQQNIASNYAVNGDIREGIPYPGFSDRVNDPEILAAVKKNRRTAGIFAFFLVPLPLIGALIYGGVSDSTEIGQAAIYGAIISAVFLIFALIGFIKERAQNTYDATVIDKKQSVRYRNNGDPDYSRSYQEYITTVRTDGGKTKKIVERDGSQIWAYNYLNIGDRFRYHPQFHFPYEHFDKSKAPYIVCVSCGTQNSVYSDRCSKCHLPLLK
ncbi:MAG: zinc-ribbon domain-containing protein [Clostridia bacterium]|nr:zinc-ribbon domain-containing protein [Clostridia bacterium]